MGAVEKIEAACQVLMSASAWTQSCGPMLRIDIKEQVALIREAMKSLGKCEDCGAELCNLCLDCQEKMMSQVAHEAQKVMSRERIVGHIVSSRKRPDLVISDDGKTTNGSSVQWD